ncbi:prepilin peptidase [Parahaliea sp. F7430]|uniref:Prepilin leader peptidase/N-methyltransferase n=1 Tax=Sediminihaliea albiluteola TaxID=2758564 RepID=A0A7W2TW09_9GAMM|nr:A24 family peptidase [Sediminihaliea albiluteola]MBA6412948.1 prepilin peptidase [Sediminihaliea albiluteola]
MLQVFSEHSWLLPLMLLALGLVVGSFLNVVIYRLPLMMEAGWRQECASLLGSEQPAPERRLSLASPNSHCPHCEAPIKPWHNIPVLSYLLLRGKCANCKAGISLRYPLVELSSALASMFLALHFGPSLAMLGAVLLTWSLISLTLIDFDHHLLPDSITLPLLWAGLLFNLSGGYVPLQDAVIGAIAGYLSLWSVYWLFKLLTGKEGMGYGDFKLLAALGAWLGWQALPMIILLSSLVGAVAGIALMLIKRRGKEVPIPFGPYLAMAGWLALVWGDQLIGFYLQASGIQ